MYDSVPPPPPPPPDDMDSSTNRKRIREWFEANKDSFITHDTGWIPDGDHSVTMANLMGQSINRSWKEHFAHFDHLENCSICKREDQERRRLAEQSRWDKFLKWVRSGR